MVIAERYRLNRASQVRQDHFASSRFYLAPQSGIVKP